MKFTSLPLAGAYLIDIEKRGDERGFFARAFCVKEFEENGLEGEFVQANTSLSAHRGTLRGLHYQEAPKQEVKLVRCIKGALFDVIVDVRTNSPTYGQWYGAELSEANHRMMYVPKGFAHSFITLEDNTEAFYLVSEYYAPECERGLRWNDPSLNIQWPIEPVVVSPKDNAWPLLAASCLQC